MTNTEDDGVCFECGEESDGRFLCPFCRDEMMESSDDLEDKLDRLLAVDPATGPDRTVKVPWPPDGIIDERCDNW